MDTPKRLYYESLLLVIINIPVVSHGQASKLAKLPQGRQPFEKFSGTNCQLKLLVLLVSVCSFGHTAPV